MSFANLYYQRTTATAKACYVCYKPTTTVLATINTTDFIYTCPGHLADPGFASPVVDGGSVTPTKATLSPEEIAKVKEEWEEAQKKKKEKEKEKANAKEKEKETEKDKDKGEGDKGESKDEKAKDNKTAKTGSSGSSTPATSTPTHRRFSLHRDFFAMRQAEHRKRRQIALAKDLAPRLPGAPRGSLPDPL
jgi:type IV secretory pathway VirB10-like protein